MVRNNHEEQESPWAGICGLVDSRVGDGGSGSKGRWQGLKRRLLRECPSGPSWTFILRVRLYISSMAVSWNSVAMKCPDPTPEQWDESEFWGSPTPLNHVHAKLEKRQHEVSLPRVQGICLLLSYIRERPLIVLIMCSQWNTTKRCGEGFPTHTSEGNSVV